MKLKRYASLLALLPGLILLGYLFMENNNAYASETQVKLSSTPILIDDPVGRQYQAEIEEYRQDLNNPKLSDESRKIVEANLRYAEQKATQRASTIDPKRNPLDVKLTAIAQATQDSSQKPIQTMASNPLPKRGIHYDPSFIFIKDASFYSAWVEPSDKDTLWFLGGHLRADKNQGVVYVYHELNMQTEKYYTPSKSGLLKTSGFENNRIIFNSEKGTVFYFDIQTRQFVDENGKVLHTITPTPLPTTENRLPGYPSS